MRGFSCTSAYVNGVSGVLSVICLAMTDSAKQFCKVTHTSWHSHQQTLSSSCSTASTLIHNRIDPLMSFPPFLFKGVWSPIFCDIIILFWGLAPSGSECSTLCIFNLSHSIALSFGLTNMLCISHFKTDFSWPRITLCYFSPVLERHVPQNSHHSLLSLLWPQPLSSDIPYCHVPQSLSLDQIRPRSPVVIPKPRTYIPVLFIYTANFEFFLYARWKGLKN